MFLDNLCCCAKADAVQHIIRVVGVVHALHPERDPQVFLLEHKRFNIRGRLRNNTTELLGEHFFSDSAQRRARTCIVIFTLIERRRSTPALEEKIASQVSWTFDGDFQISTRCLWQSAAIFLHQVARECSKDKPIIVDEDAELLVQRGENHTKPSPLRSHSVRKDPSSALSSSP